MLDNSAELDIVRLRPLQSADLDTFLQLGSQTCSSLHGRPNQSKSDLFDRYKSFVKEFAFRQESEIWVASSSAISYLGHIWLYITSNRFNGNSELWVWDISVMPEHRGKGTGRIFMEYARNRAMELQCKELWLLVAEDNEVARKLYASCDLKPRAQMLALDL
ncbi:MAG: GNAT family N-acetyltransferase [bacterium]|nr:GNAT family N-acetyltransferase [bacterium]